MENEQTAQNDEPKNGTGIYAEFGQLPPSTVITEAGLAKLFGRCGASIKAAVDRGELPRPVRIMGKPTWTAGASIRRPTWPLRAFPNRFQVESWCFIPCGIRTARC